MLSLGEDQHVTLHLEMKLAAKFRAGKFILARLISREVNANNHPRNQVLLEPQLRHPEIVNDVFGAQDQFHWPADGNCYYAVHHVVFGARISFIEADEVQRRVVYQTWIRASKNAILAGVVKVPLKLLRYNFNL